jgi:nitroreductase
VDTYLAVASKRDWRSFADRPVPVEVITRILDAGRVTGSGSNKQPWRFVVVKNEEWKQALASTLYVPANVAAAAFAVAIVTEGAGRTLDVGRAMQNMMLVAWNDGVAPAPTACPIPLPRRTRSAWRATCYRSPFSRSAIRDATSRRSRRGAEEWSAEANRMPLDELVIDRG